MDWSEFTPTGHLTMEITQKGAVGFFKPGKSYRLEFTEVDE